MSNGTSFLPKLAVGMSLLSLLVAAGTALSLWRVNLALHDGPGRVRQTCTASSDTIDLSRPIVLTFACYNDTVIWTDTSAFNVAFTTPNCFAHPTYSGVASSSGNQCPNHAPYCTSPTTPNDPGSPGWYWCSYTYTDATHPTPTSIADPHFIIMK